MFPRVDEEAVEAAERGEEDCGGKQSRAQAGRAGDCGDEDGGGKEEADDNLFRKVLGGKAMGGKAMA